MNREQYLQKRTELMNRAQAHIDAGELEEAEGIMNEVKELDKEFESLSSASNFLFGHKYSGSLISTSCKNNTEVCGYHFVFI